MSNVNRKVNVVTIIGANGAMGCAISGIFASFGGAKVYMVCRNKDVANNAKIRATGSVKAESIGNRLYAKAYEDLPSCLAESDLVFESVAEDIGVKKDIYSVVNRHATNTAIIATGTSGLSITEMGQCFDVEKRKNFVGLHFFNPPYALTLCEIIPGAETDLAIIEDMKLYLKNKLVRDIVVSKDRPAFIGNRLGFFFINLALQYADKFKDKGGIDYIDAIFGGFTGRSMTPLVTSDFVGLDVHKAIVNNIYDNTNDFEHESFDFPEYAENLVKENKLGRKTNGGLYKIEIGEDKKKTLLVYDICTNQYRPKNAYSFSFATKMVESLKRGEYNNAFNVLLSDSSEEAKLCSVLLARYAIYGLYIAREVGESIHASDITMVNGYGWISPLGLVEAMDKDSFISLVKKVGYSDISIITELMEHIVPSKYDYRRFLKASF